MMRGPGMVFSHANCLDDPIPLCRQSINAGPMLGTAADNPAVTLLEEHERRSIAGVALEIAIKIGTRH